MTISWQIQLELWQCPVPEIAYQFVTLHDERVNRRRVFRAQRTDELLAATAGEIKAVWRWIKRRL